MAQKTAKDLLNKHELHHLTQAHIEHRLGGFKRHTRTLRIQIAGLGVLGFVSLALVLGLFHAFITSNPAVHASVAGQPVSGISWQATIDNLDASNKMKTVTLVTRDGETETTLASIGAGIDVNATKQLVQNGELQRKLYPWKLLKVTDYSPIVSVDTKQLNDLLKAQNLIKQTPVDAKLVLKEDGFTVIPGVDGWQADIEALSQQLSTAVLSELTSNRVDIPVKYSSPMITTKAAEAAKKAAEDLTSKPAIANYDSQIYTVPPVEQKSWVKITPDENGGVIRVSYDPAIVSVSAHNFAASLTNSKIDRLIYHLADNSEVVSAAGRDGRAVLNTNEISKAWTSGAAASLVLSIDKFAVIDGGILTKNIIVDLNNLVATAYENGVAVNSFPVSGGKPSTPTPIGTYKIYAKTRIQTMSGPGYSTPNIQWVSWFYPDYALHGAYWHNDFGIANVSHGCVNFRNPDAEWIYNWAPIGTPVTIIQS